VLRAGDEAVVGGGGEVDRRRAVGEGSEERREGLSLDTLLVEVCEAEKEMINRRTGKEKDKLNVPSGTRLLDPMTTPPSLQYQLNTRLTSPAPAMSTS